MRGHDKLMARITSGQGNPYAGEDIRNGIRYDTYEANVSILFPSKGGDALSSPYRAGAKRLASHLSVGRDSGVLDIGSGTGILTLEILTQNPGVRVVGVEEGRGMMEVAKYKFHQRDSIGITDGIDNPNLWAYWESFRDESGRFRNHARFICADFQEVQDIAPESFDAAIGNQVMHWMDLGRAFGKLGELFRPGASIIWNSSSQFFDDAGFPAREYGFRYNGFISAVLDEVAKRGIEVTGDHKKFCLPANNLESFQEATESQGFRTEQVDTLLIPMDLQTLIRVQAPDMIRKLISPKMQGEEHQEEVARITNEALASAIQDPNALSDIQHKYDIVPILKSTKQ